MKQYNKEKTPRLESRAGGQAPEATVANRSSLPCLEVARMLVYSPIANGADVAVEADL